MIASLKAEFKKLLTVRSTYFISLIALLLVGFVSFYVEGNKNLPAAPFLHLTLASSITQVAGTIGIFGALIALLLLTHEYRYNTIVYTLTASNSRSKVFMSKIVSIIVYIFIFSLILGVLSLGLILAGASASGHSLPHQDISYITYLAKVLFYSEGMALTGLVFAALIRNQVGAIAALFIIPGTVEGLLGLLFKQNSVYMPFTALQQVIRPPDIGGVQIGRAAHDITNTGYLSAPKGALVFLAYLFVGWIVAWYLFLKRDAS